MGVRTKDRISSPPQVTHTTYSTHQNCPRSFKKCVCGSLPQGFDSPGLGCSKASSFPKAPWGILRYVQGSKATAQKKGKREKSQLLAVLVLSLMYNTKYSGGVEIRNGGSVWSFAEIYNTIPSTCICCTLHVHYLSVADNCQPQPPGSEGSREPRSPPGSIWMVTVNMWQAGGSSH